MKNLARLTLFFSLNFMLLFLAALILGLLSAWIEFARFIPTETRPGTDLIELAFNALPAALYLSVLLTLSYTARRAISIPAAIAGVLVLGSVFYMGLSFGMSRFGVMEVAFRPVSALHVQGEPGLILSRSGSAMILLRESGDAWGPRVVSIPGQPLIYQEVPLGPNNTILSLHPLPFDDHTPWFIRSLGIDFFLNAEETRSRLEDSLFSFGMYAFSLILLLASMRFVFGLSKWPLANLFFGALVFRGIVALEGFLNAREINALIDGFLPGNLPPVFITPAIFGALAVLFMFYTLLIHAVRPRRSQDE